MYLIKLKLVSILACAFILQTLFLSWMPGLQGDSAWLAWRSFNTVYQGNFILTGVTDSNGVLNEYLFALCYNLLGANLFSIRVPFAIMNVLTVLLVYLFVKRLHGGEAGLICSLMMAVYPWFTIYNRLAWNPSSIPFITMLTLFFISNNRLLSHFFAGLVIGLACYNYQLFVCLPVVLLILFLVFHRRITISRYGLAVLSLGAIIGYVPKILCCLFYEASWVRSSPDTLPAVIRKIIVCCPYFLRIMDGSVIFLKTTGAVAIPVIPLNSLILLVSICILIVNKGKINRPLVVSLFIFFGLIIIPDTLTSVRYFMFMMVTASLISGLGVYRLFQAHRRLGVGVLILFVAVNLFYIINNFFVEFSRTGGRLAAIKAGNYTEVSHVHVRTDVLYDTLDRGVPVLVIPSPFIAHNLKFYDLNDKHFKFDNFIRPDYEEFYYIYYAWGYPAGEAIDPNRFPDYEISREHPELVNFNIFRFKKKRLRTKYGRS